MNAPKVRMDRGRDYSTVHGERGPGDRHAAVHFYQDGLPFDAQGFLLVDHEDLMEDTPKAIALRALAERKMKKASSQRPVEAEDANAPSGDGDDGDSSQDSGDDGSSDDKSVNLEAWLRGEEDFVWHLITQTIAQRFKRRVSNAADAVTFLVEQRVVPANQVAKKFQKHLETV